jgi:hypothetical protein
MLLRPSLRRGAGRVPIRHASAIMADPRMTETLSNITSAVRTDPLEALTAQMLAAARMAFQRVETPGQGEGVRQGHSVFQSNPNESECQVRLGRKAAARGRTMRVACPSHQPNSRIAEGCHHVGNSPTADLRPVFIPGHIPHPMRAVLTLPLPAHERLQP